jgi:hypothetical protein
VKYQIEITETLQKVVEVEARSLSEAITKVATDYSKGEIVLDAMDFVGYEIKDFGSNENEC